MGYATETPVSHNTYSHTFGIIIPDETGVEFTHQSGGMSCTQVDFEGVFLPLTRPTVYLGTPDWSSDRPDTVDVPDIDLTDEEIPDRDWDSFPEWVKERGHFYNYDEYFYWLRLDKVDWYGSLDLIEELRLWDYDPSGELHKKYREYNPVAKWESRREIWSEIDDRLPFVYERWDAWDARREAAKQGTDPDTIETPIPDGYPEHGAAFKWVEIQESKRDDKGRVKAQWADDLAGEHVLFVYENSD